MLLGNWIFFSLNSVLIKMDDLECPRCKSTKYRNPNLKMMVNSCGHGICENCVELLFIKGSAACPQCNIPLRRSNFRVQIFEDPYVEKDLDVRRRILKDYNKKEEDFETLREYNDYLEEVETIIYNLVNNIDVDATKRKVEQYKKENKTQINRNRGKRSKDEEILDDLLEQEQHKSEVRKQERQEEETELHKMRVKKKEALIDDLMFSDLPASEIMASHTVKTEEITKLPPPKKTEVQFSTGLKLHDQQIFLPVPKQKTENKFVYSPQRLELCGPTPFTPNTLNRNGFLNNVRAVTESEQAAGFKSLIACDRALHDAFCGLHFVSVEP